MTAKVEHVLSVGNQLGEGPMWDPRLHSLVWVDIEEAKVWVYTPATGKTRVVSTPEAVTAICMRTNGGWVVTTKKHFAFLDLETGKLERIAGVEEEKVGARFNDGAVDRQGRFWAGTMTTKYGETSGLYRLDPDLTVHKMESGITISNGIGWSLDNRIMYFTDSARYRINAYDFDLKTGSISNRQSLVQLTNKEGDPDGLTVDSEGYIWSARWHEWKICRYTPEGKLDCEYILPVQYPTSLMFGGDNLDVLYITSGACWVQKDQQEQQPLAGDIFCLKPGVRGVEEPAFAG